MGYYLRAKNENERAKWIDALEIAQSRSHDYSVMIHTTFEIPWWARSVDIKHLSSFLSSLLKQISSNFCFIITKYCRSILEKERLLKNDKHCFFKDITKDIIYNVGYELSINSMILTLDLSGSPEKPIVFGDKGAISIAMGLQINNVLTSINITYNIGIGISGSR